jgi:hypothetical protein
MLVLNLGKISDIQSENLQNLILNNWSTETKKWVIFTLISKF